MSKCSILLLAALQLGAQDVTFQAGTRLVLVDVVVNTKDGPVKGLTKDDFILQDKGKNRPITVFSSTETSGNASQPPALPPTVVSNRPAGRSEAGPATVILYDRLNMTSPEDQAVLRKQTLALLTTLKSTDRFAFLSLGNAITAVQDFNDDPELLIRIAKRMASASPAPGPDVSEPEKAKQALLETALTPMQPLNRLARVSITQTAFLQLARYLAGNVGRRNLMWVTGDFPLTYELSPERMENMEVEVNRIKNILSDSNIALYTVDPRGVNSSNRASGDVAAPEATRMRQVGQGTVVLYMTDVMRKLARDTGGEAFYNINDIAPILRTVLERSSVTYTLGFLPDEKSLDGKVHELTVKLAKGVPGATVEHRHQYIAAKTSGDQKQRPTVASLAADPVNATAIGLVAGSAADPKKPGFHEVDVQVNAADLSFESKNGKFVGALDLAIMAEGAEKGSGSVRTVNLDFTEEQLRQAKASGLVVRNSVPSSAGRVRIVVQDKNTGTAGSVHLQLAP